MQKRVVLWKLILRRSYLLFAPSESSESRWTGRRCWSWCNLKIGSDVNTHRLSRQWSTFRFIGNSKNAWKCGSDETCLGSFIFCPEYETNSGFGFIFFKRWYGIFLWMIFKIALFLLNERWRSVWKMRLFFRNETFFQSGFLDKKILRHWSAAKPREVHERPLKTVKRPYSVHILRALQAYFIRKHYRCINHYHTLSHYPHYTSTWCDHFIS